MNEVSTPRVAVPPAGVRRGGAVHGRRDSAQDRLWRQVALRLPRRRGHLLPVPYVTTNCRKWTNFEQRKHKTADLVQSCPHRFYFVYDNTFGVYKSQDVADT